MSVTITAPGRWPALRPSLVDLACALVLAPLLVWAVVHVRWRETGFAEPGPAAVVLTVVAAMAVAWRRVQPLASLTAATVAIVIATVCHYDVTDAQPFVVCGLLLSLAYHREPPLALAGLAVALAGFTVIVASHPPGLGRDNVGWTYGLLTGFWVVGRLLRARREMLVARAEAAEQRASSEAGRTALMVSTERLRIARELHDILSHTVSLIAVQATVGEHLADSDPAAARRALGVIGTGAREALDELRRLLTVLREEEAEEPEEPDGGDGAAADGVATGRNATGTTATDSGDAGDPSTAPAHTLADIGPLVDRVRDAGIPVQLRTEGAVRGLSPAAEACGFRIVQEALTNVVKHAGPARADVVVAYHPDALELTVTDDGAGPPAQPVRVGHGLPGMRERAALFGGSLVAGPRAAGGGFEVRARIPDGPSL